MVSRSSSVRYGDGVSVITVPAAALTPGTVGSGLKSWAASSQTMQEYRWDANGVRLLLSNQIRSVESVSAVVIPSFGAMMPSECPSSCTITGANTVPASSIIG